MRVSSEEDCDWSGCGCEVCVSAKRKKTGCSPSAGFLPARLCRFVYQHTFHHSVSPSVSLKRQFEIVALRDDFME
jgi:hypothetical protein